MYFIFQIMYEPDGLLLMKFWSICKFGMCTLLTFLLWLITSYAFKLLFPLKQFFVTSATRDLPHHFNILHMWNFPFSYEIIKILPYGHANYQPVRHLVPQNTKSFYERKPYLNSEVSIIEPFLRLGKFPNVMKDLYPSKSTKLRILVSRDRLRTPCYLIFCQAGLT